MLQVVCDIFENAHSLIQYPEHWIQGTCGVGYKGELIRRTEGPIARHSLLTALLQAQAACLRKVKEPTARAQYHAYVMAYAHDAVREICPVGCRCRTVRTNAEKAVLAFNTRHTHSEVLALLECAARLTRGD